METSTGRQFLQLAARKNRPDDAPSGDVVRLFTQSHKAPDQRCRSAQRGGAHSVLLQYRIQLTKLVLYQSTNRQVKPIEVGADRMHALCDTFQLMPRFVANLIAGTRGSA